MRDCVARPAFCRIFAVALVLDQSNFMAYFMAGDQPVSCAPKASRHSRLRASQALLGNDNRILVIAKISDISVCGANFSSGIAATALVSFVARNVFEREVA